MKGWMDALVNELNKWLNDQSLLMNEGPRIGYNTISIYSKTILYENQPTCNNVDRFVRGTTIQDLPRGCIWSLVSWCVRWRVVTKVKLRKPVGDMNSCYGFSSSLRTSLKTYIKNQMSTSIRRWPFLAPTAIYDR